jgi:hypothetical protein
MLNQEGGQFTLIVGDRDAHKKTLKAWARSLGALFWTDGKLRVAQLHLKQLSGLIFSIFSLFWRVSVWIFVNFFMLFASFL